ncbi:MAG: hypothetical protein QOI91_1250 [Solirubrobacteraceae bacterium]|jgi:hypothetical protein|nr:hypothetical protein [Solirubrobacteraceae bacterium]
MSSAQTLDGHILEIVDDFLETVVVVDDRAFDEHQPDDGSESELNDGVATGMGRAVRGDLQAPTEPDSHDFDPKAVTDAFAEYGLVCSLLAPDPEEAIDEKFLRAARRADLVVLDWVLHRDEGGTTLQLIREILTNDEQPARRRLRTIAIYTGQSNLHEVADRLAETLDAAYADCDLERHESGFVMTKGPVRAAVFAKEHVTHLASEDEDRRVAFSELPTRLRSEFAKLTAGLVTGVALAALGALRDDTHRILRTLGPELDPAYLGHRAASPDPDDAAIHAVSLVASEIRSVIEDNDVGRHVTLPILRLWLDEAKRNDIRFGELIDEKKRLTIQQVETILQYGLGTDEGLAQAAGKYGTNYFKKTVKRQATKIFCADDTEAAESDAEFAHRMMMRTVYSQPPRTLQLGTIVDTDDQYRLCVQPLCDSVRLRHLHAFPFLPLQDVGVADGPDFVVPSREGSGWAYLRLSGSPGDLVMASFDPEGRGVVTASAEASGFRFIDSDGVAHRWVAELKPDFGQRYAFDLAQRFARIAVDEAEIFRLSRR